MSKSSKKIETKSIRGRTFFFSSDESHLKLETIKTALLHRSICKWAYCLHNRDTYTLADLTNQQEQIEKCKKLKKEYKGKVLTDKDVGKKKPSHYHIVIDCGSTPLEINTVAKWFELEPFMINIAKGNRGQNPFIDCCRYLTHEETKQKEAGKQVYAYEEIKHSPNFDFVNEMKKINEIKDLFGDTVSKKEAYFRFVSEGIYTPDDIHDRDVDFYNANERKLKELRYDYILNRAPLPSTRLNFYIEGSTGLGKSEFTEAFARSLNPNHTEKDTFFYAKKGKYPFDKYNGQAVIIWDDFEPKDIIEACKGMTGFYNVFDKPRNMNFDVKGSCIRLLNKFNIITHTTNFKTYLNALDGQYTYTKQIYDKETETMKKIEVETEIKSQGAKRRIPMIFRVNKNDYDIYVNKGWLYGNSEYQAFEYLTSIEGNFAQLREHYKGNKELAQKRENALLQKPLSLANDLEKKRNAKLTDKELEEADKKTENYGKEKKKNLSDDGDELPF